MSEEQSKIILSNIHEQLMSVMFLNPNDCVLELGGNIGRNSCVIGKNIK